MRVYVREISMEGAKLLKLYERDMVLIRHNPIIDVIGDAA